MYDAQKLYAEAFKYVKTGLWMRMYDDDIFAVQLPDGETAYACVMGRNGEMNAIFAYVGDDGFQNYLRLRHSSDDTVRPALDEIDRDLGVGGNRCVGVVFAGKQGLSREEEREIKKYARLLGVHVSDTEYPHFMNMVPFEQPARLTEERGLEVLSCVLGAANGLARLLVPGVTPQNVGIYSVQKGKPIPLFVPENGIYRISGTVPNAKEKEPEYPVPGPLDDATVARLKRLKKTGTMELRVARLPDVIDMHVGVFNPLTIYTVRRETKEATPMIEGKEYDPDECLDALARRLQEENWCPATIRVCDPCSAALVTGFCQTLGIRLERRKELEYVMDLYRGIKRQMGLSTEMW